MATKPNTRAAELLMLWAFTHGAKWEPPRSEHGEFVFNGIRYTTTLDAIGVPVATASMLNDIVEARDKWEERQ